MDKESIQKVRVEHHRIVGALVNRLLAVHRRVVGSSPT